jgi:hypothetical protein
VFPAVAQLADEPSISTLACDPDEPILENARFLRALSLDLRGEVPTAEELDLVTLDAATPEDLIDSWLDSDAFADQAVRHHRKLLWNNIEDINFITAAFRFARHGPTGIYWRRNPAARYRGETVRCADVPADIGPAGEVRTDGQGLEGYREIVPYWSTDGQPIKVCAFDAQDNFFSENGTECATRAGANDVGCGCGPDLRWCAYGRTHQDAVNRSMATAMDRLLWQLFREDRPYSELFTTRTAHLNGPLKFFWSHQTQVNAGVVFQPRPIDVDTLAPGVFTDMDSWEEVQLSEVHAGILTRPAYLLRFQTNRARANRFYDAFLCTPFNPPPGGLPVADEESTRNPDVQLRAGCKYCHAILEPAASHWGRWTEQGAGYLSPADFPPLRSDCETCALRGQACSAECRNFYTTNSFSDLEDEYLGMLNAYRFRREDHVRNIEAGPRLVALAGIADNRLPSCVARRAGEWLLGRDLKGDKDEAWVQSLSREFVFSGLSFRSLVKSIVTDPRYRRVR